MPCLKALGPGTHPCPSPTYCTYSSLSAGKIAVGRLLHHLCHPLDSVNYKFHSTTKTHGTHHPPPVNYACSIKGHRGSTHTTCMNWKKGAHRGIGNTCTNWMQNQHLHAPQTHMGSQQSKNTFQNKSAISYQPEPSGSTTVNLNIPTQKKTT